MSSNKKFFEKDFKNSELLEGETPKDINEKCIKLCKDYLIGIWSQIDVNQIVVNRISGGLSNMMFHCSVQTNGRNEKQELIEVAIRLYGEKPFLDSCDKRLNQHNDAIVSLLMSEQGLGPKLLGSFPGGQILQFIKHRHFRKEEQNNPTLVSEVARKLARLHSMRVPINRNINWVLNTIYKFVEIGYTKFSLKQLINEYNLNSFKTYDLNKELEWIEHIISGVDSPICFSHNDFRGNNIMITKELDMNSNSNEFILFCDFEVSGYGYRGSDFGTLFAEWNREDNTYKDIQKFPEDITLKAFIDEYIRESVNINGENYSNDERNSFEHILKETKVFTLVSYIFMLTACLAIDGYNQMGVTKMDLMFGADIHFKNYINLKNKFIRQIEFEFQ